jgi:hypothetical protein
LNPLRKIIFFVSGYWSQTNVGATSGHFVRASPGIVVTFAVQDAAKHDD